jgi:hypothetical protein
MKRRENVFLTSLLCKILLPASNAKHVKWGNSNEQIAIEKHLEQNNFDELIMTACVMTACVHCGLFVNTEPPWLGAIQTACYIIMQSQQHLESGEVKCPFSKMQTDF